MANAISKFDDVIDSRDIIERIEELEALRKPWVAGWNMPGYMPDSEPARFETFEDARDYIADEMARWADEPMTATDQWLVGRDAEVAASEADALTEASKRWSAFEEGEHGETVGKYHFWIATVDGDDAFEELEDAQEYRALKALADEAEDYAPDWTYGAQLIRDSYFVTAMQELCEEIGDFPNGVPSYYVIDWEATARNLRVDYTEVDFDGVTYWVR